MMESYYYNTYMSYTIIYAYLYSNSLKSNKLRTEGMAYFFPFAADTKSPRASTSWRIRFSI